MAPAKDIVGSKVQAQPGDAPLMATEEDWQTQYPLATPQDKTSPALLSPGLLETDLSRLAALHLEQPPGNHQPALDPTPLEDMPGVIYAGGEPLLNPGDRPGAAHIVDAVNPLTLEAARVGATGASPGAGVLGTDALPGQQPKAEPPKDNGSKK